jgi:peptide/nickel transport system permease protein
MNSLKEIRKYPSAIAGIVIIVLLVTVSIVTIIAIPYSEATYMWRGGEDVWDKNPRNAAPLWINWFRSEKMPETMIYSSMDEGVEKVVTPREGKVGDEIELIFDIEFTADEFPSELTIYLDSIYEEKAPFVQLSWIYPDGTEVSISDFSADSSTTYRASQDKKLERRVGGVAAHVGLFADQVALAEDPDNPIPLKGEYTLKANVITFEENTDIEIEAVLLGKVFGWAGTDHRRRDISLALLWGTPIALSFGLLAAVGTTLTTLFFAAIGVWIGGWVDELIQRITEVNMVLPFLNILIMVGTFYNRSIWLMLGMTILLSIFGAGIKTYRAMLMQVKESPYIEAAQSYGAGSARIILRYLIPRVIPTIIPALVVTVPGFVFLEASLALLGLGDPVLPTWGKLINDARVNGALYTGDYYWLLEPSVLLMVTGFAFAMLGFSLDRIFNPRLRGL